MSIRKTVLFFFILFFVFAENFGQNSTLESQIKFDNFSIDKGLSQSTVLSIYTDNTGFVWIGTRNGLNRFNGYDFTIFQNKLDDPSSINGNVILDINQDEDGQIYIATNMGLSLFDEKTHNFFNFQLSPPHQGAVIQDINIDMHSRVWLHTSSGLILFDRKQKAFIHLSEIIKDTNFEKLYSPTYAGFTDDNGILWVGTNNKGVFGIDVSSNIQNFNIKYNFSPEVLQNVRVEDILPAEGNKLWVATYGKGLFLFDMNGNVNEHYSQNSTDKKYKITHNSIRSIAFDNNYNLWIGTFKGLNVLNTKTKSLLHIFHKKGDPNSLPHGSVRRIAKDKKGSIWIGTYFGGISYFDTDNQKFKHYYNIPGNEKSLSFDVVGAFSEEAEGNILVGTERGGLNILNIQNNNHQTLNSINDQVLKGLTIKSIKSTGQYSHWLGTFKQGLKKYDSYTNTILSYPKNAKSSDESYLKNSIINCIETDTNGFLWLGLDNEQSLAVFDPFKETFVSHPTVKILKDTLLNSSVKHILFEPNGDLFLSTRGNGLVHFSQVDGKVKTLRKLQFEKLQLDVDNINHTTVIDDKIWISTHGLGLICLNKKNMQVLHHFNMSQGLLSNIVYGTLTDNNNDIWVLSSSGISKLKINEKNYFVKSYNYASGLPIQEINEGAFFKTASNEFLIGGNNGYVKFNPENLTDNDYIPQVTLTDLKITNKSVFPDDHHKVLEHPLHQTKEITLNYKQSIFTIEFALLSYLSPENNSYKYMLEGFDEDWINAGNNRTASYTNLKSGQYTFKVKGANNDNIWNNIPTELKINVLPPPWKTWWAYLLYTLLIISGLYMIRYNALKGAKMKLNLEIEKVEKERLKELHQLKLKYFTDISHEFRTPLTLITSPLEELLEAKKVNKWTRKKLKTMYYSSKRLLLLVEQILEFREIESGNYKVKAEPLALEDYLLQVVESFKILADKKSIQLNFEYHCSHPAYELDKDKLDKILFNLLSNAFKFTPVGGTIFLEVNTDVTNAQSVVNFSVSDTGSGIDKLDIEKIFNRFYTTKSHNSGSGIGLALTKSLVEILKGNIKVVKSDKKGTEFLVQLPLMPTDKIPQNATEKINFSKPIPLEYSPQISTQIEKQLIDSDSDKENILIVEDTDELRDYLKSQLKKTYNISVAENGKKALKLLKQKNISLVISDIMMPKMDGIELCEYIKKTPEISHIPIILLTAKTSYEERLAGLDVGADDYIAKPFHIKEIKSRIKNILSNRKRLQNKFKTLNYFENSVIDIGSQDEKLLEKLIKLLEEKLDDPTLTVDEISKELGLSRVHLFRKMKAISGMTPSSFIKDFRLKKAKSIFVANANASVAEVAYNVGFQDVKYFSKCFKKYFGKSPNQLSKQHSAKTEL